MKALVQRVKRASVSVDGQKVSSIGPGLLILLGVIRGDSDSDLRYTASKCAALRIFDDADGVPNLSVRDVDGEILAVSQFTLAASTRKGNRPSYINAAPPQEAEKMYDRFCDLLGELTGKEVRKGVFRTHMEVELLNDGPMTIMIDSTD